MARPTLKQPSAYLPVAMSLTCIAMFVYVFTRFGVVHHEDEGAAAHIFQLLMGGQLPIIAFFVVRWVPENPRRALPILALQLAAALAAMWPVWYFEL